MAYQPVTALRHAPKQVRGERKVDKILRSAEIVFAEVGYEHATTNAVAKHAGISIGSLYQFFSSKDAILEAMAQRYLDQTRVELLALLDADEIVELPAMLTGLVETMVHLQLQRPYFLQCLNQNRTYSAIQGSVAELNAVIADHVVSLLGRLSKPLNADDEQRRATICVYSVSALLPLAIEAKGRARTKTIAEIVTLLVRYLTPELSTQVQR